VKKILTPGLKLEITNIETRNKKKGYGYISQIEEYVDDKTLIIGTPIVGGQIVPLRVGNQYALIIYSDTTLYRCKILIKNRLKKGLVEMLKVEIITQLEKIQRREFFRCECIIPFKYNINDSWEEGIIKDISGGGLRFITNVKLQISELIICDIPLDGQEISARGRLISREDSNTETYKYQYRVSFEELSKIEREKIIQYIFLQQRKRVQQHRGL